jgi:serine/threonine protein phosphatase PrpC
MPRHLFINADTDGVRACDTAAHQISVLTRPLAQAPNQDCAAVLELENGACVLTVADGMGGGPAGDTASRLAVVTLCDQVEAAAKAGLPLRAGILNGFESAHQAVLDHAAGAATTLLVAELQQDMARLYQVGDSSALVFGQRGLLKQQTTSHSPVGYAVRSGLLGEDEALVHEDRHYVSNMIGFESMSVEVGLPFRLAARDTIVLGSDGLFDNLSADEVVAAARTGPLGHAVTSLATLARQRMADNEGGEPRGKPDDLAIIGHRLNPR